MMMVTMTADSNGPCRLVGLGHQSADLLVINEFFITTRRLSNSTDRWRAIQRLD
jgi:hypothetical protein